MASIRPASLLQNAAETNRGASPIVERTADLAGATASPQNGPVGARELIGLEAAIAELSGVAEDRPEPELPPAGKKPDFLPLVVEDAKQADAFVTRWRARLPEIGHARHRGMVEVILGETLEHKRFFDQIIAGRDDVLGRRANGPNSPGTGDGVLPVRWME